MLSHKIVEPHTESTEEYGIIKNMYRDFFQYLNTMSGPTKVYVEDYHMSIPHTLVYKELTPIGFFTIIPQSKEEVCVLNLYTLPEHRPSGILDYMLNQCRSNDFHVVMLDCRISNTNALNVYKSRGFELNYEGNNGLYNLKLDLTKHLNIP